MSSKESLEKTLASIRKTYGAGSVLWFDGRDQPVRKIEVIPSGSLALDIALGGGFPKGRIVEIYGGEATGKSSMCLHLIAEAQKQGMTAAFIDVENALDPSYAKALGVRLGDVIISQPDDGEQAMGIAEKLIRSGDIGVVVIDSVAALVSKAELEGSIGDSHVGLQSRLMSQSMRILSGAIAKSNTIVVFTNQTRQTIGGGGFGPKTTTSGGKALGYYASVRIKTWNYGKIEDGDNRIGGHITAEIVKNKISVPYRKANLDVIYGKGIVRSHDLINAGKSLGIITQKGSWLSFGEENIGQGVANSAKAIEDDAELANKIEDAIRTAAGLPDRFIEPPKSQEEADNVEQ